MKYFYQEFIDIETISIALDTVNLTASQKQHLAKLIDSMTCCQIMDSVLSRMSVEDGRAFLHKFQQDPQDKELINFLRERIDNVERQIKQTFHILSAELVKDMEEAKLYV